MIVTTEESTWGTWRALTVRSTAVSLVIVPGLGGRVVSLTDRRSGREWLLQSTPPSPEVVRSWSTEAVEFSGPASFGWDECVPSVAVSADPVVSDAGPLRDHGDQWARPTEAAIDRAAATVEVRWDSPRWPFTLSRRISLATDGVVHIAYQLENHGRDVLPFLWSMHPVLPVEAGSHIDVPGVDLVSATWFDGIDLHADRDIGWPLARLPDGASVLLSETMSNAGWAAKLYGTPTGPVSLSRPDGARLEWDWDRAFAPAVGIWLSYGAWPPGGPAVEQIAIEPTTSADDHLGAALANERAKSVEPGAHLSWWVSLTLTP